MRLCIVIITLTSSLLAGFPALAQNPFEGLFKGPKAAEPKAAEPVCTPRFMPEIDEVQAKYDAFLTTVDGLSAEDNVIQTHKMAVALDGKMQSLISTCAERSPADKDVVRERYEKIMAFLAQEIERIRPAGLKMISDIESNDEFDLDKKTQKLFWHKGLKFFAERDDALLARFNGLIKLINTQKSATAAALAEATKYNDQLSDFLMYARNVVVNLERHEGRTSEGLDTTVDQMEVSLAKNCVTAADAGLTSGIPADAPVLVGGVVNQVKTLGEWRELCLAAEATFGNIDAAHKAEVAQRIAKARAEFERVHVKGPGQAKVNKQMRYAMPEIRELGDKIRWIYRTKSSHAIFSRCEEFMFSSAGSLLNHRSYACED